MSDSFLAFCALAAGMAMTPGPNMIVILEQRLGGGALHALATLGGVASAFAVYAVATVLGLTAVLTSVPGIVPFLYAGGGIYLLYLAAKLFRGRAIAFEDGPGAVPVSYARSYRAGLVTNLCNPKAILLYLALFPRFLNMNADNLLLEGLQLAGAQIGISVAINVAIIGLAATVLSALDGNGFAQLAQRRIMGLALGAFALLLLCDGFAQM